jgi:hypothetical protein
LRELLHLGYIMSLRELDKVQLETPGGAEGGGDDGWGSDDPNDPESEVTTEEELEDGQEKMYEVGESHQQGCCVCLCAERATAGSAKRQGGAEQPLVWLRAQVQVHGNIVQ